MSGALQMANSLQQFRGHKRRTTSIVFSPDSRFLASTGWDGKVRFWKMPPRNYSWLWLFCAAELAAIVYWQRGQIMAWLISLNNYVSTINISYI